MSTQRFFCLSLAFMILAAGCKKNPSSTSKSLHKAVVSGDLEVVESLIKKGAEVNVKNDRHCTPLHYAAEQGHVIVAELLIANGANVNAKTINGDTPLFKAICGNHRDVVELLITKGADVNTKAKWNNEGTPLHEAASKGYMDIARVLIANGADVNAMDNDGHTPLHEVFFSGYLNIAELLIAEGADVNARDLGSKTPLHKATSGHYLSYATRLLDAKYAESKTDGQLKEPSMDEEHELARTLKIKAVKLLISKGADVNARDYLGRTPFDGAILWGSVDTIKILLENGANPNVQDEFGSFLLHEVVADNYPDVVKLLLDYGADANMVDAFGQTPLHEAAWNDCKEMIDLIIAKGADINVPDRNGDTPLHVAALNGYTELYNLLVAKGADIHAKNDQGKTPVDYANSRLPQEVVILSEDKSKPYSVIITNLKNIRRFLKSEMIDFDQIWIPEKSDIEGLVPALRTCLEKKTPVITQSMFFEPVHVLKYLHKYNREYTGFFKDGTTYIICNMSLGIDRNPQNNMFTWVLDGGSNFIRVVFDAKSKEVVSINCNGM